MKFLLIVTLIFGGYVFEYPDEMEVRAGKVVDKKTGEEVKPCRKASSTDVDSKPSCPT